MVPKFKNMRKKKLPFARPDITEMEIEAITRVLRSGWLTSGPEVEQFEIEFANFIGVKAAIAVNSATAALHLSLCALDIGPDDAVIIPAFTFTATAEVVTYSGAHPIILDVDRSDYLLSPKIVNEFIKKECIWKSNKLFYRRCKKIIRAIIPVHLGGRPCKMDEFKRIAGKYNMRIIEDASHALPSSFRGKKIGSIGDLTAFSFYATKNITTGEGGMVTTNNQQLAERIKMMRLHGIEGDSYSRMNWQYDVKVQGFKYNMMDLCAAMGRVQLKRITEMHNKRAAINDLYRESFSDIPGIYLLPKSQHDESYHLFSLEINQEAKLNRDHFMESLDKMNISTSLHFIPLYRLSFYKNKYGLRHKDFPNSESIFKQIASIPIYSLMTPADIDDVIFAIKDILL